MYAFSKTLMLAAAMVLILAGCESIPHAGKGEQDTKSPNASPSQTTNREVIPDKEWNAYKKEQKAELRVLYASEKSFYADYGNLFLSQYPNVEIKVIPLSETRGDGDMMVNYEKVIEEQKPDIILMTEAQYEKLAQKGRLYDLSVPIRQSKYNVDSLTSGVVDLLKARGGGTLFGLANTFRSKVIYVNKDLFEKHGVPYPVDGMSWEELLQLAERFPDSNDAGKPLYGLFQQTFFSNPFEMVQRIGMAKGLTLLDAEGKRITMDTPSWREVFELVVAAYANQTLYYPSDLLTKRDDGTVAFNIGRDQLFLNGQAAMAIDDLLTLQMMDIYQRMGKAESPKPALKWDTVTLPVDPVRPQESSEFKLDRIYGISSRSETPSLAWEFLRYIHSDEYLRLKSKSSTELLASESHQTDASGRDLSDFYALKPDVSRVIPMVPSGFTQAFEELTKEEIMKVLNKEQTPEEALSRIQARGQQALDEGSLTGEKEEYGVERVL